MSLVTLERFLNAKRSGADPVAPDWQSCVLEILSAVAERAEKPEELQAIAAANTPQMTAAAFRQWWEQLNETQQASQSGELSRLIALVNEALMVVASGSDRSTTRLDKLEVILDKANAAGSMAAVRTQLTHLSKFVKEEREREAAAQREELSSLGAQFESVRETVRSHTRIPNRDAALDAHAKLAAQPGPGTPHVYVFVLERLRAISARYEKEVSDNLVETFARMKAAKLTGGFQVFRWAEETVIALGRTEKQTAALSDELASANVLAFDHRIVLGSRVASLSVPIRHTVLPANQPVQDFADRVDRFTSGQGDR